MWSRQVKGLTAELKLASWTYQATSTLVASFHSVVIRDCTTGEPSIIAVNTYSQ
jgi:hypothetical protein